MLSIYIGGSGSGKSLLAEKRVLELACGKKYYLATMEVYGEEGRKKVQRHQEMRKEKGFETIEKPRDLVDVIEDKTGTVLLECMSNLVANEMFRGEEMIPEDMVVKKVCREVLALNEKVENLVIVTNNIFEDGVGYEEETRNYIRALGKINERLVFNAQEVYEVVVGIEVKLKG